MEVYKVIELSDLIIELSFNQDKAQSVLKYPMEKVMVHRFW